MRLTCHTEKEIIQGNTKNQAPATVTSKKDTWPAKILYHLSRKVLLWNKPLCMQASILAACLKPG